MHSTENAWLSTLRPDGSPHLTPVWFVVLGGDTWWVCASERSVKARNIAADPRVSIALEHGYNPVVAEGAAKIHTRPFPATVVEAFDTKYGWDITAPFEGGGARVLFEIPVTRWLLNGEAQ